MKEIVLGLVLCLLICSLGALEIPRAYKAGAYSLLLPGGGQIYNREYVKAGVVIGLQAALVATAVYHDGKRDDYTQLAEDALNPLDQQYNQILADDYRDKFRSDIWWIGITAALSAIDAWIDSHLLDYESEKERIHMQFADRKLGLAYRF